MATKKPKKAAAPKGVDDDVERFLAALDHPAKAEILAVRALIRGVDPAVQESVKWNAPSFHTTEHFATFHLRHEPGVQVVLHLGAKPRADAQARATISDPGALLRWRGVDRATVTFESAADVRAKQQAFVAVLRQWIALV